MKVACIRQEMVSIVRKVVSIEKKMLSCFFVLLFVFFMSAEIPTKKSSKCIK